MSRLPLTRPSRVPPRTSRALRACFAAAVAGLIVGGVPSAEPARASEDEDPPAVQMGERLFLETRFSQHFFATSRGDVNAVVEPDPVVAEVADAGGDSIRGPFRREAMNCRQCHLVDEVRRPKRVRTYADFARRSPVPARDDGAEVTLRNSPALVGMSRAHVGARPLLHFDGEFATAEDLVVGTYTGRNLGWLPGERDAAVRHIARVLRGDDGRGELAREFGGRYRDVLQGESQHLVLPLRFRIDVDRATDEQLVRAAARLVAAYLRSLDFIRDAKGAYAGSSFDAFLAANGLPRAPRRGETAQRFTVRLRAALERLDSPRWIDGRTGTLALHGGRPFRFGPEELRGLRVFLATPEDEPRTGTGNCATCHPAPDFTDFAFHNTGVSQAEYDRVHGEGAFAAIRIPSLDERNADPSAWLPPASGRTDGAGPFAAIPSADAPGRADLGVWNVLFDPARPRPQAALRRAVRAEPGADDGTVLDLATGAFKTPSLRSLGQSSPYLHDGSADTLAAAVQHYVRMSDLARAGAMRNAPPEMAGIRLAPQDVASLVAFLRSLDEDYE